MSPMDQQEGQALGPAEPILSEDQKREQRARLIKALSRFRPRDANPQQFYNCVREQCIIHNCSIDEGLERAAITWPGLSQLQRQTYDSQRHAELPIPVPRHLLYRAFQKERTGLWSLGRSSTGGKHRYTLESYKPPPKASRLKTQLLEYRPKYDNRLDLAPKVAAMRVAPTPSRKLTRTSPSSGRRIRTITPPEAVRQVRSSSHISPVAGVEITKKTPRRRQGKLKKLCAPEPGQAALAAGGMGSCIGRKKVTKRKGSKAKRLAKDKHLEEDGDLHWEQALGSVRRRLMMHLEV